MENRIKLDFDKTFKKALPKEEFDIKQKYLNNFLSKSSFFSSSFIILPEPLNLK